MSPRIRKFALTAHLTSSVGWLGAVAVFLALAVVGLTSRDARTVRGVYLVMEPTAWLILVPLSFASLLTGVVMSLGTAWGLFRHYWVLFKLLITIFAIIILLQEARTVSVFAARAAEMDFVDPRGLESYVLHSGLGVLVLLVPTVLSVYKPRGRTPWTRW